MISPPKRLMMIYESVYHIMIVKPWDLGQKPTNMKPKVLHAFGKELHTVLRESKTLLHLGANLLHMYVYVYQQVERIMRYI